MPAAAAVPAVSPSTSTPAPAVPPGTEQIDFATAVARVKQELGLKTPEGRAALKELNDAVREENKILAFGKNHWVAISVGTVATIVVVGGVVYYLRRRSALAAAAVEAAAATAGLETSLIEGVSRGLV